VPSTLSTFNGHKTGHEKIGINIPERRPVLSPQKVRPNQKTGSVNGYGNRLARKFIKIKAWATICYCPRQTKAR